MTRDGRTARSDEVSPLDSAVVWSVTLWIIVVVAWYFRFSLWFFDLPVLVVKYLLVAAAVAVTVRAARLALRRPVLMAAVIVVATFSLTFVGWWQLAPRVWFAVHWPLFEVSRAVIDDPTTDYYGAPLPFPLRFLSQTGTVSAVQAGGTDGLFFPQWVGIPDDAGGYLYSPVSPEGADLYGSICTHPQRLGAGWWMCNLS